MKVVVNTNANSKGCICALARQIQLRERVWLTWCVCVLHDLRVFAKILDPKTNWYAFNDSLHGYQPNRNQQQKLRSRNWRETFAG